MIQTAIFTLLAQLLFASFAAAAPVAVEATGNNAWQYGTGGGILGLVVLIVDIIFFVEILKSNRAPSAKLLWSLLIFLFPVFGMIIYFLFSNRETHNQGSGYEPLT
ncbi:hypothetical protein QBC37DRAFT_317036 [Rhypophila decipiens]|uniref:Cardiolipin synthase N-terminal domain-containing protein n=1 Tax=Rhypophila decipiens TaxID=261697 RepID=A0AAN7B7C9_9PEZI|nr:hypothetical protein QBC37DRAFT_317036 [Rhypophila decipiens]